MSTDIIKALLDNLTDEQKKKLAASLMGSQETETVDEPEVVEPPEQTVVNEDFTVTRGKTLMDKQKQPVRAKPNTWTDDGEARDPEFDAQKFEKLGKAARSRSKPKKVQVECHVCGKSFHLPSSSRYGEFTRCNRCVG